MYYRRRLVGGRVGTNSSIHRGTKEVWHLHAATLVIAMDTSIQCNGYTHTPSCGYNWAQNTVAREMHLWLQWIHTHTHTWNMASCKCSWSRNTLAHEILSHCRICNCKQWIHKQTQNTPVTPLHPNDSVTRIPWITVDHRSIVGHKLGIVGFDSP